MKRKFPLSYRTIQKIKAEEYERFFDRLANYYPYMNHLGEIRWMTEQEALNQHEYFLYSESVIKRWLRRLRLGGRVNLGKLSEADREIRLHIRETLERKYTGEVQPETAGHLPQTWKYEINEEELENIPITIDVGYEGHWRKLWFAIGLLAVVAVISFLWVSVNHTPETGKLLVRTEVVSARVYLDETDFVGYSNKIIRNVPAGMYRVTAYKEGEVSIPKYHEVEIIPDSVITLDFQFKAAPSRTQGYLKIIAEQSQSQIFVDNKFYGLLEENPILKLDEGQHAVQLKKEGYVTVPSEKVVTISAGDTSLYILQQVPMPREKSRTSSANPSGIGSIAVTSNVKNARIFINGRDTGYETDYVFTQLPLKHYSIRLHKEGYSIEPEKRDIVLTSNQASRNVEFFLTRKFERIRITTEPREGPIYIDGEFKGEGKFEGVLKIGEHHIAFGDLSEYKTPPARKITLQPGNPVTIQTAYFPEMRVLAGVDDGGLVVNRNCEVQAGYTYNNQAFTSSGKAGPVVVYHEKLKAYVWKLGYAFTYRNPKGNDAIKVMFSLPRNVEYNRKFTIRMLAAASREKYPLTLTTKTDIYVKFNNTVLSYYYEPEYLEDTNGLKVVEWDVASYIKPGTNSFEISTTEKNNTFFYIKRIEIFN